MRRQLAIRLVRIAVSLIRDPRRRARYEEQWLADIDGAAEVGLSPLAVGIGACRSVPALRTPAVLAVPNTRHSRRAMPPIGVLGTFLHLVHGDRRPGWVRLVAIAMGLALLAGIGLLLR
ncbi:hypothetical protein [Flindersiella endophytica]